jgi:hypothetical protein
MTWIIRGLQTICSHYRDCTQPVLNLSDVQKPVWKELPVIPGKKRLMIVSSTFLMKNNRWADKHLLRVSGYKGIKVLRPRKFVDEYYDTYAALKNSHIRCR